MSQALILELFQTTKVCSARYICMVYTLSPLAFRPASDKSSSLSSRNLSAHALAKPFDMPRTSKQKWSHAMSFPHAGNLLRKKLQSCNWTHPTGEQPPVHASFLSDCPSYKVHRFFRLFGYASHAPQFLSVRSRNGSESRVISNTLPSNVHSARLQGLNLLDKEGTERAGSKVATALHRILWAATGRFGCG